MQEYQDTPLDFQTRVVLKASFEVDRPLNDHLLGEAEACCRSCSTTDSELLSQRISREAADGNN
jgi:hypothetical protein